MSQQSLLGIDETLDKAMERAGRWLSLRPRTEAELRARLQEGGFEPDVVERALGKLKDLRLIDDLDYARQWIEERAGRKGLAGAALVRELGEKGVAKATATRALEEAGLDDTTRAIELAAHRLTKLSELPVEVQAGRLEAWLARRGFDEETVMEAVKAVLPPEGWD